MSRPTVLTACIAWLLRIVGPQQHPHPWRSCAGGGAVHSINSGRNARPILASLQPVLCCELLGDAWVDDLGCYDVGVASGRIALALLCDTAAQESKRPGR